MTLPPAQLLRGLALVLLFGAWAGAAHYASAGHGSADFNAALGVLPIVFVLGMPLWRLHNPLIITAGGLSGMLLLAWLWPQLRNNIPLLYYLQHLGTHLALGTLFGRTLFGPGEALITRIARGVFGDISERKQRYTRQVTIAWTIFFFANALLSTTLFLFAPPAIWSIHANLLTAPLIGLMFLGEHLVRLRKLPPEERPSFMTAIRAYRAGTQPHTTPVGH